MATAVLKGPSRRRRLGLELIEAAVKSNHKEVQRLIEDGADLEATNHHGYTAISEAAIAGHTAIVGQLLRALADPNRRAEDGRTALHRAAFHGWTTTVRLLLDNGADPAVVDERGATPASLARRADVRKMIEEMAPAMTRMLIEERRRKIAEMPLPPEIDEELEDTKEVEAPAASTVSDDSAAGGKPKASGPTEVPSSSVPKAFSPPVRSSAEKKAEREKRYQEALAELIGSDAAGEGANLEFLAASLPKLVARFEVMGAGEERLNGTYTASFLSRDRVEFVKEDDEQCQVYWCDYHSEWRMLIGDYKLGSTLYRNSHRPNLKVDECHGVPEEGWQKWFGKDPEPLVMRLPPLDQLEHQGPAEGPELPTAATGAAPDAVAAEAGEAAATGETPAATRVSAAAEAAVAQRRAEFLEMHPRLKIVKVDETGAARRSAAVGAAAASQADGGKVEVSLTGSGSRLVETADGLFGADEVEEEVEVSLTSAGGVESHARAWLREDLGDAPSVPRTWAAVQAAKAAAADMYKEGRLADARQATTAAIRALDGLASMIAALPMEARMQAAAAAESGRTDRIVEGDDAEDGANEDAGESMEFLPSDREVESLRGVLYSNRSLLLLQEIQAGGDAEVLSFGTDAAWRLVVDDADRALKADASNFKASFRRARALYELGELREALSDATSVVEHYARTATTPNPEAAALREKVQNALKKENKKWGEKGPARWNRGGAQAMVTEVSSTTNVDMQAGYQSATPAKASRAAEPKLLTGAAVAPRPAPAPKTSADIEKALLTTMKGNVARQAPYLREHLPAPTIKRLFRRAPPGPDLLAAFIVALAHLAKEDSAGALERLAALAATPSAQTHAAMLDATEKAALQQLLAQAPPDQAAAWVVEKDAEQEKDHDA